MRDAKSQSNVVFLQEPIKAVSVIIPCKNEENAIGLTVEGVSTTLTPLGIEYEIIVVDDGSNDQSRERALAAGAKVLVHSINMGYGNAIMNGMRIAVMDADGTYPISELPRLIEESSRHDMVIGSRVWTDDNSSLLGKFLRKSLYYVILYFSNTKAKDYNSGFRVFHKMNTLDYRPVLCPTFSFTTSLTLLYLLTMRSVFFVDVEYSKRIGSSKVSYIQDAFRTFSYVFILTSLFQPYRLSLMIILLGFAGNLMVIGTSAWLRISNATQIGLHITVSLAILIGALSMVTYPVSKKYLDQLHGGNKYE
jgi:polyisoprenyl-phosphate glycosyltransferase